MSDSQALNILMKSPVTHDMVAHIVNITLKVIQCKKSKIYPSPPSSPNGKSSVKPLPSLMTFISRLVRYSNVYTGTLLCTLVYLERLSSKLPKNAQGLPCTLHRIFLAALIISSKFNNDSSPTNKYWASYTDGLFTLEEINLMERQLLQLMNWDVIVSETELAYTLRRFVEPIKQDLKKATRIRRSMSKQRLNPSLTSQYSTSGATTPMKYTYPSPQQAHIRSHSTSSISSLSSSSSMSSLDSQLNSSDDESMTSHLNGVHQIPSVQCPKVQQYAQPKIQNEDDVFLTSLWGNTVI